ncbi:hypothetical protein HPP92_003740 [Vanilla planifolia]|uniref:CG-1 domain-containing protein n=1 Tax=Vanilla planifolia TaxID=51239 RepID=A0A835S0J2_VANPL|nr:hypothetical protein HPP92_003740 [Vanilla planifolia]
MDPSSVLLIGGEIHGFRTLADLDITRLMDDATTRWFRPNEIHAILTNYTHFGVQPQPVEYPTNGRVVLFDRTMLRNFRKDGYSWKKKKDGKTVQEAHEKLKIGNEERIHVYYARGEDDPNFYRRCYWLLDKKLERIVLVHYRHTTEQDNAGQGLRTSVELKEPSYLTKNMYDSSPLTPVASTTGSAQSDYTGSGVVSEEIDSSEDPDIHTGSGIFLSRKRNGLPVNELSLHDINNLDWAELALASECAEHCMDGEDCALASYDTMKSSSSINDQTRNDLLHTHEGYAMPLVAPNVSNQNTQANLKLRPMAVCEEPEIYDDDIFLSQNLGQWHMLKVDTFGSLDVHQLHGPISNSNLADSTVLTDLSSSQQVFNIKVVSPAWAYSTEETKVLVIGDFNESYQHLKGSNIYCMFGQSCVVTEMIQPGVYQCICLPQASGKVNVYLTLDCHTPISQVVAFDYRSAPVAPLRDELTSENRSDMVKPKDDVFKKRLAHLLFTTTSGVSILNSKLQPKAVKEAKKFALLTAPFVEKDWKHLLKLDCHDDNPPHLSNEDLFELVMKNKLREWLSEKIAEGCKITANDSQGQGVIHLCAILEYTWAVSLFSLSGLSLDFRDSFGWTALHWAAYLGREKMVAALLSADANPSLVTDPTPENPGGLTAADLASKGGHEGLAAYLAEKALTAHFEAMTLSGNMPSSNSLASKNLVNSEDMYSEILSEQELCLKESLAAYRNAADAADRIQAAFRERALKQQTAALQLAIPETEATHMIAALRIQHAYRKHARRRLMKAALRIQSHFRTWQTRKDFLNKRQQAVKIQAFFRGHQVRKQYRKIVWSVGVLEKAILRWRLKRKGLRGMHVEPMDVCKKNNLQPCASTEEDFFQISRQQAQERVQRSVIRVQSMFRSYRAQQEYRRMKLAHEQAKLEFSLNGATGLL